MADIMQPQPHTIGSDKLAVEALKQMEDNKINGLIVIDAHARPLGALNMHDLLQARIV